MKFKKLESGRSMVEMLGVLAIIGVLSVGGIAGYSLSMRRHRANGIVDLMSKYALVFYSNCQQKILRGEVTGVNSPGTTTMIYDCSMEFENADIGSVPAGIEYINTPNFVQDLTTGADIVSLSATFDDDKLCQAVGAITGTGCKDKNVSFEIKQN